MGSNAHGTGTSSYNNRLLSPLPLLTPGFSWAAVAQEVERVGLVTAKVAGSIPGSFFKLSVEVSQSETPHTNCS